MKEKKKFVFEWTNKWNIEKDTKSKNKEDTRSVLRHRM